MTQSYFTKAPEVQDLVRQAFPEYQGKSFAVQIFAGPMTLTSNWSGGQRDYWALVNMSTGRTYHVPENGTPWTRPSGFKCGRLPLNVALVRLSHGYAKSTCVYVHPENITKYLPPAPELTQAQRIVLCATRGLKSSYAGIKDYRFHEAHGRTGITREAWDTAKAECIGKGLLNRAGAISDEGRNAIGTVDLWNVGKWQ